MRLIDADAFIERLKKDPLFPLVERYGLTSVIYTQKTVDPVKHGRWTKLYQGNYKCSECGDWWATDDEEEIKTFRYCPNCGAKMDEEG